MKLGRSILGNLVILVALFLGASCKKQGLDGLESSDVVFIASDLTADENRELRTVMHSMMGDGDRIEIRSNVVSESDLVLAFTSASIEEAEKIEEIRGLVEVLQRVVPKNRIEIQMHVPENKE